ncbi:MAG: hypothetical protein JNL60_08700 [Bacteroidia bacterium]|nr:hypothetical protein [Bacteroidia bacterium]
MKDFKEALIRLCEQKLIEKARTLGQDVEELKRSMETETKSSVGDKHETARARMQAEEEKLSLRMREITDQTMQMVRTGKKLIVTDKEMFLLAVALGKIEFEGKTVFAISPVSPIGSVLTNCRKGDKITFNGKNYEILEII